MKRNDDLIDRVKDLPPAPQILPPLLEALGQEDTDLNRVVEMIAFDPALTLKLLKTCNSASLGRTTKIDTVSSAIQQLGFQTVYRIVASVNGASLFKTSQAIGRSFSSQWWRHAVMTAFASQFVAEDLQLQAGLMFTAGLLHDVGQVVLLQEFKGDYVSILNRCGLDESQLVARETDAFGLNHAELGGRSLEKWQFSPLIVGSVRGRNDLLKVVADDTICEMAACLQLGNALAKCVQNGNGWNEASISMEILDRTASDISRYTDLINENMNFVEAMCRLN